MMVKSYNETGGLFLKTSSSRNGCTLGLSEKQKLTSRAYKDKESALSGGADVMQIMSLPDELYDTEKSNLFFSLKESHKKPFLSGDALRFIVSRSTRMKELEGVVFGKALTPEERLSCYKINIKSQRDLAAVQQIVRGVQGDAADKNISNLLAAGNLMLLVLRILMEAAKKSGDLLGYNVSALSLLADNSGEMQEQVSSIQQAIDWLTSWRGAKGNTGRIDNFNPSLKIVSFYIDTVFFFANTNSIFRRKLSQAERDSYNNSRQTNKQIALDVCRALRSASTPKDCAASMLVNDKSYSTLIGFQEHLAWIKRIDNIVSTEREREQVNIRTKTTDKQVSNSSVQYLLNMTRGVRKDLANFHK